MSLHTEIKASGYFLVRPNAPLERRDFTITSMGPDEVIVKVAGCGLCHTDIGFLQGHVKTKQELPLVLGHEISGTVIESGETFAGLRGRRVVVPAVLPCGECELCRVERDNICQRQKMPGNDFSGGFATHVVVPGRFLCPLPDDLSRMSLSHLSVVADAVTTPYQSLKRSQLLRGDVAVVIGVGGIGIYLVQHARNAGAHVVALDVDEKRLAVAAGQGAEKTICVKAATQMAIRDEIRSYVQSRGLSRYRWRVFETSGTVEGQQTAYSLLSFAGSIAIVGFTMEKTTLRLSNVMAFDADIFGNWGCRPAYYPEVVEQVLSKKLSVSENVTQYPLDQINEVIQLAQAHRLERRAILVP